MSETPESDSSYDFKEKSSYKCFPYRVMSLFKIKEFCD